jgi:hypothetical protein
MMFFFFQLFTRSSGSFFCDWFDSYDRVLLDKNVLGAEPGMQTDTAILHDHHQYNEVQVVTGPGFVFSREKNGGL